jgi:hypothetical protein
VPFGTPDAFEVANNEIANQIAFISFNMLFIVQI